MFFDPNYLLFVMLPALLLSFGAQMLVRNAYSKWSQIRNSAGLTGAQVAQHIIRRAGLGQTALTGPGRQYAGASGISLQRTAGQLTDHYDPRTHTVRLSDAVANQPSVVAMAVAAHELGHAQQHEQNSILIQMRSFLIPAVQISPMISYGLIFIGLIFGAMQLFWLGILFFAVVVAFTVLTLPVEIDASRRGLRLLTETGLLQTQDDESGSRQVLTAAALTYVAAAVTAVLQLLYYVSLAQRRQ
jgi:Zn-dependent membrane protease YugP